MNGKKRSKTSLRISIINLLFLFKLVEKGTLTNENASFKFLYLITLLFRLTNL